MSGLFRLSIAVVFVLVMFCAGAFIYQYHNNQLVRSSQPAVVVMPDTLNPPLTEGSKDDTLNNIQETLNLPEEQVIEQDKIAAIIEQIGNDENQTQPLVNEHIIYEETSIIHEITSSDKTVGSEDISTISSDDNDVDTLPRKTIASPKTILDKLETKTPLIAIVIDDMGINLKRTKDIIGLNAPLTSSFLTYGNDLEMLVNQAGKAGHEIMIHAPMEPKVLADLAPDTLKVEMNNEQIETLFSSMLKKFENLPVSGINNHMGSKFTENKEKLRQILNMLKNNNMYFLDSKTTSKSKGKELALEIGIDYASRDVFLDNKNDYSYIMKQLAQAEAIAQTKGFSIAICHPKSATYQALKDWIQKLPEKNLKLVHISEIIKLINK